MAGRSHSGKPFQTAAERHWESEYFGRTWVTAVIMLVIAIFLYKQKGPSNPGTQLPVKPEGESDPGTQFPVKEEGKSDPGTQFPVKEGESDPGTQFPVNEEGESDPGTQFPVKEGESDPGTQFPVKEGESDPGTQFPVKAEGESDPGTQFPVKAEGESDPGTQFPVKAEGESDPGTQFPVKEEGESDPGTQFPVKGEGESDPGTQFPVKEEGESDPGTQFQIKSEGHWENQYVIVIVIILAIFLYRRLKHRNLRFRVVCYGQGDVHKDILMGSSMSEEDRDIPYVLYVYKVSRELMDLRTALRFVEKKQMLKRKDICAVILLEKVTNAQNKTIDIDHQGIFDGKTVVVRICWEEKWFLFPRKVQKGPGYWKAMEKVIQSIREW
ncbi:uncharacterized protein LOC132833970 [Hemiscyllium ocellatum]|uniref:uncharacterized protein LOC132833970 n=1 Tax=Hemiscyllium ocellatum TaxID=170820 RepID=UPI0029666984|nr:uncharacterized protein LOC132833970 [Hemiscyllium ocellatum]